MWSLCSANGLFSKVTVRTTLTQKMQLREMISKLVSIGLALAADAARQVLPKKLMSRVRSKCMYEKLEFGLSIFGDLVQFGL